MEKLKGLKVGKVFPLLTLLTFQPFNLSAANVAGPADMVRIPAGEFMMGSDANDGKIGFEVGVDSIPKHTVSVPAFWIDRYEVTIGPYRKFVAATGRETPSIWKDYKEFGYPAPEDHHPVIDVNFYDAEAYCRWAGKRLPSEEEWEKAARGTDGRIWPWGNRLDLQRLNTEDSKRNWTTPAGSFPGGASPYGVYDMAGNAMEWTSSILQSYRGAPKTMAPDKKFRVLRGGSWGMPANPFARPAHRHFRLAELAQPDFGFRCAKDADERTGEPPK
ncbi:MAG TPA: SUMF1/EgtB/PvdO family nonheme iron enzyme [Nitrospiria bacterium]|nr:SUMF1/EgtB/PvdO family nonheme iron enzyme [Nitrospiria bacterium]